MKTIRAIFTELKKYMLSLSFAVCIIIALLLCFCSLLRYTADGAEQSVFEVMISTSYEDKLSDPALNFVSVFRCGSGIWFSMFVPVAAAFAFAPIICDERSGGNIRLTMSRTGKLRYCVAKTAACAISAGAAITAAYIIYGIIVFIAFPMPQCYPPDLLTAETLNSQPFLVVLEKLGRLFIYGAVSAQPALLLTPFIRNKFLVMCIPFMLKYILMQVHSKLLSDIVFLDMDVPTIVYAVSPDSLLSNFTDSAANIMVFVLYGVFLLLCPAAYWLFTTRRLDCGA